MKKYLLSSLCVALMVTGCAKTATALFQKDEFYERSLTFSRKADLLNSFETKAIVSATYLSAVSDEYKKMGSVFVVGVYITNDFNDKNRSGLLNPEFALRMDNNISAQTIQPLAKEDPLLKKLPFINNWAKYYLVTFPQSDKPNVELHLLGALGKASMLFPKVDEE